MVTLGRSSIRTLLTHVRVTSRGDEVYQSVVAVGAHPDDVEGGCGGTLIKLADAGTHVTMVSITNGDKGSFDEPDMPLSEMAQLREAESRAAAATIGADYVCLGEEDQFAFDSKDVRLALADVLRAARADLVLASPPVDYQADHTLAGELAIEACHLAALPQVPLAHPALAYDPVMYYYDSTMGLDFQPVFYVDITDVMDRKQAMVACHASQSRAAEVEHGWSLPDMGTAKARLRGLQSGVAFAEGFAPCLRWPRVRALTAFPS